MFPQGKRILVIDDNPERREFSERILTEDGFAVIAVGEGLSAVRAATRTSFALAVVALRLPGSLDGPTVVRLLRGRQAPLKALFVGPAHDCPAPFDHASDGFIPSPFQRRELLGCVFELLQREGAAIRQRGLTG